MPVSTAATAPSRVDVVLPGSPIAGELTTGSTATERATRELAEAASKLLRMRSGELAEPAQWAIPGRRRRVQAIVAQLAPIRSRDALVSSYLREAHLGDDVRLAYALAWLALARVLAAAVTRRRRGHAGLRLLRGRG